MTAEVADEKEMSMPTILELGSLLPGYAPVRKGGGNLASFFGRALALCLWLG